jgi:hypothetical protein
MMGNLMVILILLLEGHAFQCGLEPVVGTISDFLVFSGG